MAGVPAHGQRRALGAQQIDRSYEATVRASTRLRSHLQAQAVRLRYACMVVVRPIDRCSWPYNVPGKTEWVRDRFAEPTSAGGELARDGNRWHTPACRSLSCDWRTGVRYAPAPERARRGLTTRARPLSFSGWDTSVAQRPSVQAAHRIPARSSIYADRHHFRTRQMQDFPAPAADSVRFRLRVLSPSRSRSSPGTTPRRLVSVTWSSERLTRTYVVS